MTLAIRTIFQSTLLGLAVLALLSLPFAHRAGAAPVTPQALQFIAMGGTLADICGDIKGHGTGGCEACQIVQAIALPATAGNWQPDLTPRALRASPALHCLSVLPLPRVTPPARAPPFV